MWSPRRRQPTIEFVYSERRHCRLSGDHFQTSNNLLDASNQYGGMKSTEAKRLKELEAENQQLKEIVAEQQLDIKMLKHITEGN